MLETVHLQPSFHISHNVEEGIDATRALKDNNLLWLKLLQESEASEKSTFVIEEFEQYFVNLCEQKADFKLKNRI